MNEINWQEKVEELTIQLKEIEDWLISDTCQWGELPKGVKRAIVRGQHGLEERLEKYKEWAKKEEDEITS